MKGIIKYKHTATTISIIVFFVLVLTRCMNKQDGDKPVTPAVQEKFAGSAACAGCHKNIYENHINTAHFHTSAIASGKNIKGSFEPGKNIFIYTSNSKVAMEKRPDGFYQAAYIDGIEKKARRFGITVGSATKGQTYLYWWKDTLFQLPVTYFTPANQWSNSPGYPGKIAFGRPVTSRCLECHTTYAQTISAPDAAVEKFNHNILYGVDCEKCHGPAAKHVAFQTQHPKETKAAFIINPATFNRQQSLDMCTLCHGGRLQKTKPSFTFTAGDKLSDYFLLDTASRDAGTIDVHGNQYGLLAASKCFLKSKTLTCITCHNPHENEKGKAALFSQRCISCHNDKHTGAVLCKMSASLGAEINNNCTNCHMPEQPSGAITVLLQGADTLTPALMHTHFIKVYPAETKKVLAFIKNKSIH